MSLVISLAMLTLGSARLPAVEVERAQIWFDGRAYRYSFAARVNAKAETIRRIVTDYDRLARLNSDIVTSRVIEREGETSLKRQLLLTHCILIFCFDLDFVETVDFLPNGDITTTIIPGEGNFRRGASVWRIEQLDARHARVKMEGDQEPTFWIPPVIGPLVMKRSFIRGIRETIENIERLANAPE